MNTFTELTIEVKGGQVVRAQLKQFLDRQNADGNIVDAIAQRYSSQYG